MKLVTLIENTTLRPDLKAEHGLSLYLEACGHNILFDAGQSGAFADNAQILGTDLSQVDTAILSHGHYDHGGGFLRFLELNRRACIYASPHAGEPHFNARGQDIGLPVLLTRNPRFVTSQAPFFLSEGLFFHTLHTAPTDTSGQKMLKKGELCPEDFRHEQYLLVEEGGKKILISGCSHKGIVQIAQFFRPDILIGGFHFMNITDESTLSAQAHALLQLPTTYYTGHCTGLAQYQFLKEIMKNRLHSLQTGTILTL